MAQKYDFLFKKYAENILTSPNYPQSPQLRHLYRPTREQNPQLTITICIYCIFAQLKKQAK